MGGLSRFPAFPAATSLPGTRGNRGFCVVRAWSLERHPGNAALRELQAACTHMLALSTSCHEGQVRRGWYGSPAARKGSSGFRCEWSQDGRWSPAFRQKFRLRTAESRSVWRFQRIRHTPCAAGLNGTRSVPDTVIDLPVLIRDSMRSPIQFAPKTGMLKPESVAVRRTRECWRRSGLQPNPPGTHDYFPVSIVLYVRRPRPINMRLRVFSLRGQSGPNNR